MKVLSLFDGISCGRVALSRAGIKVTEYYASEIDKFAIQCTKENWKETIHVGSVCDVTFKDGILRTKEYVKKGKDVTVVDKEYNVGEIDLVIGGSPCQSFSVAGDGSGFDGKSGLFWEFMRVLKEVNPKYFLLENVVMKKEWQKVIDDAMGVEPIKINSSLVSAQSRNRLYWTNIPNVTIPVDKGIILSDILETNTDPSFDLSEAAIDYMNRHRNGKPRWEYHKNPVDGKASCLTANMYKGVPYGVLQLRPMELRENSKMSKDGLHHIGNATDIKGNESIKRVYADQGKSPTLTTSMGGHREPKVAVDTVHYRKLTPLECERLQTLPDNYTASLSNTQRYKSIGNGWTVDVIAHIFKGLIEDDL